MHEAPRVEVEAWPRWQIGDSGGTAQTTRRSQQNPCMHYECSLLRSRKMATPPSSAYLSCGKSFCRQRGGEGETHHRNGHVADVREEAGVSWSMQLSCLGTPMGGGRGFWRAGSALAIDDASTHRPAAHRPAIPPDHTARPHAQPPSTPLTSRPPSCPSPAHARLHPRLTPAPCRQRACRRATRGRGTGRSRRARCCRPW